MKSFLSRLPVWAKVIGVLLLVVVIRNIIVGPVDAPVTTPVEKAPEMKNLGQRVFGARLQHYAEVEGHVLVAFKATSFSRKAIESDLRSLVERLDAEARTDWSDVAISVYADFVDKYGRTFENNIYTITFQRTEVEKVADWNLAKIDQVGKVEFIDPGVK